MWQHSGLVKLAELQFRFEADRQTHAANYMKNENECYKAGRQFDAHVREDVVGYVAVNV